MIYVYSLALLLVLLLIAYKLWKRVKYRLIAKNFGVVEDKLIFRSGLLHPALVEKTLLDHGIQVIASLLQNEPDNRHQQAEQEVARKLDIDFHRYPLLGDGTGNIDTYAAAVEAIIKAKQSGKPILVHCAAGAQRTGGAIAFYRLLIEKQTPASVYQELIRYGWRDNRVEPLLPYINRHMGEVASALCRKGYIDAVPDPLPQLESKYPRQ